MPSIVGTWKLVEATARDAAGKALATRYGGKAMGRVTFTADGRMMSVVCDGRAELPSGASREYSSYCGNYTYDGARLVTRVDAASDQSRIGSDQVRGVRFEGERMILMPPPRRTGINEEYREITWERIAAEWLPCALVPRDCKFALEAQGSRRCRVIQRIAPQPWRQVAPSRCCGGSAASCCGALAALSSARLCWSCFIGSCRLRARH